MMTITRRRFLSGAALAVGGSAIASSLPWPTLAAPSAPIPLSITTRSLDIKRKAAKVYGIFGPSGDKGLSFGPNDRFTVALTNRTQIATTLHWHGQSPPSAQDGVPTLSQSLIPAGGSHSYDYALTPGTHWMHAHGLEEMQLMAAPLIVRRAEEIAEDRQEVVVLLHDFSFTPPEEVLASLTKGTGGAHAGMSHGGMSHGGGGGHGAMNHGAMNHGAMNHGAMNHGAMNHGGGHGMAMAAHPLNDWDFDAYLANDRTLDDPQVIRTEKGGRVRLRLINAAAGTAFWVDLGRLTGQAVAVDGMPVEPVSDRRFPLAQAQRLDILIDLPSDGAHPILFQREGDRVRTGVILAAPGARVTRVAERADKAAEAIGLQLETRLRAVTPLAARKPDRTIHVMLGQGPGAYSWTMNGQTWDNRTALPVKQGERVALVFHNPSPMAHPMHLHGHHFQVVALGHQMLAQPGAVRDTLLVPAMDMAAVVFDADNPGRWALHCHNLLHMMAGMMGELSYESA